MTSIRRPQGAMRVAIAVWLLVVAASCERTPSKSDYVSARVTEMCGDLKGSEAQACRIAVIKEFVNVPFEEMVRRFPKPEPRRRPSCAF